MAVITRRRAGHLLAGLIGFSSAGAERRAWASTPPALTSPLILRDSASHRYTPRDFGCRGDGAADDTAGLDAGLRWLASRRLPMWLDRGTYRMVPGRMRLDQNGAPDHLNRYAGLIDYDHFHMIGAGGRIVLSPPDETAPGTRWYAFSTLQNLTAGAVRDVTIEGAVFDLDNEFSLGRGGYCCALIGVDGITVRQSLAQNSSGQIRGSGYTILGSSNIRLTDFSIRNLQQGLFASYVDGVTITGFHADRFTEAIDFDSGCRRIRMVGGQFSDSTATRQSQCIDLAAEDAVISNITATRIPGNIIGCYTKFAWGSYAEHVAMGGRHAPHPPSASRIVIDGVRGSDIGGRGGYPAIFFNLRRPGAGNASLPVPDRQSARNITLTRSSGIALREGNDCTLEHIRMTDITSGPQTRFAAIWIGQTDSGEPAITESRLSGEFRDLSVMGTNHHGIIVDGIAEGGVSGLRVEGFGTAPGAARLAGTPIGIGLLSLSRKAGRVEFGNLTAIDSRATGFACAQISDLGNDAPMPGKSIVDRGTHRFAGSRPLHVAGGNNLSFHWQPRSEIRLPRVAVRGSTPQPWLLHRQVTGQARWIGTTLVLNQGLDLPRGIGATFSILKRDASGTTTLLASFGTLRGPVVAGTVLELARGLQIGRPEATLLPGEHILLGIQLADGAEAELDGLVARVALLSYTAV